jgi:energy-coupling factor transporter ATP-binding protein EcfA2
MTQTNAAIDLTFDIPDHRPRAPGQHIGPIIAVDGERVILGSGPIVFIGANGAGKSRLASLVATTSGVTLIPADRQTDVPESLGPAAMQAAEDNLRSHQSNGPPMPGMGQASRRKVQDIHALFNYLKAEEAQVGIDFYRATATNSSAPRPTTKVAEVERLWRVVFPERNFNLKSYSPQVERTLPDGTTTTYPASNMSEGERSILYLIARIVTAPAGIVLIDEPEVHMHTLLARRFWDVVEQSRPDCRFAYVTHDLAFALSRRHARMIVVRTENSVSVIPASERIPPEVFEEIYGAATLSVSASRLVFCEGVDDGSIDRPFYEAWFNSGDTSVAPVGNCSAVRQSTAVFQAGNTISAANPVGLIERDFWPDEWLASRSAEGFHVLPVHEIEGLFCLKEVAEGVALHLGLTDFLARWATFEANTTSAAIQREPVIVERAKRHIDVALEGLANAARSNPVRAAARAAFVSTVDISRAVSDIGAAFDAEASVVDQACSGSWNDYLKVMPNKRLLGPLAQALGTHTDTYTSIVIGALKNSAAYPTAASRIEQALQSRLPPR